MKQLTKLVVTIILAFFLISCKKEVPSQIGLSNDEIVVSQSSQSSASQSLPEVSKEFDKLISETRKRCEQLKNNWPIDEKKFKEDLNYLLARRNDPIEVLFNIYYRNLKTWQNLDSRIKYIYGHFKNYAPGDIKTGVFQKYNAKNNGKVYYKGKIYTVEQLGNINFGIACKAIGFPYLFSACAAGCYQLFADQCLKPTTENAKKLLAAIKKAVTNNKLKGLCFDYPGDSKMIKAGYNWY